MMRTVFIRRKPLLFLIGISVCFVTWMAVKRYRPKPPIKRVLRTKGDTFYLGEKPFRILSGSIHYFRVVPEYWMDRLLKLKAMGLNTVETYVPWNLHEETKGKFNFEGILDIEHFIKLAQTVGLYVIVRPGPYICAEWDLGGLPSWLLRDPEMQLRSMYPPYIEAVDSFFRKLIPILKPLQLSQGGPIVAFQVENEYGSFGREDLSSEYMVHLKELMVSEGLTELLFTSDGIKQIEWNDYQLPGVLRTVNFQNNETVYLEKLKELQPDTPLMVAEFWPGWFDHWGERHQGMEVDKTVKRVSNILRTGASINLYMFHGGTNFGFMNGGNYEEDFIYRPTVTSYDYDAPLSEAGDITDKFKALRDVLKKYNPDMEDTIPEKLLHQNRVEYEVVEIQQFIPLADFLPFYAAVDSNKVMSMERLPINSNSGQGYGFTMYQTELEQVPKEIKIHNVSDRAQVLLDSEVIHTIDAMREDQDHDDHYIDQRNLWTVVIKPQVSKMGSLGILVENLGRVNFLKEMNRQRKGILGDVQVDGKSVTKWKIFALEFKQDFFDKVGESKEWKQVVQGKVPHGPTLYRGVFDVSGKPKDTFLHMKGWAKGVCFVNGHNLGRYWNLGPQETLYVPAPWLHSGENELVVFELESCKTPEVSFSKEPVIRGGPVYRL